MVYLGFVVDVCHRAAVCDETKKIIAPWCGIASVLHSSVSTGSVLFQTIPEHVGVFMLGAVCCDWSKIATSVKIPFWAVCLSFAALEYFYIRFDVCHSVIPFIGIATIIYLSDIISRGAKKINGLLTISATSYIIYLFHTTFEGAAKAALQKFAPILLDDPFFAVGAVLVISAGVAGPMVLYRYILAKYKLTQFIFGIKRQQAASDRLPAA